MDRDFKFSFKLCLAALLTAFAAWLIIQILPVITYFLVAFIIVYFIAPLVNMMVVRKVPPVLAAICSFLLVLLFFGTVFYLILPGMLGELIRLSDFILMDYMPDFVRLMNQVEDMIREWDLQLTEEVAAEITQQATELIRGLPGYIDSFVNRLFAYSQDVISGLWAAFVIVFIVFYLLVAQGSVRQYITRLFPVVYRSDVKYILGTVDEKVGGYIRGTIIRCFVVGILVGTFLYLAGMPFSLMLGVMAGLLDVIIYVGPVLSAVPAVLLSLVPGTPHFLLVIGIYVLVQFIESMVLTPLLMGKAVDLSPLTIIAAILIGAQLGGLVGIIISIPVAAVLKVLLNYYYVIPMEEATSSKKEK